ncbi:MAG: GNAT family N-acetyltransferase, partial [Terriglobia bacterium]
RFVAFGLPKGRGKRKLLATLHAYIERAFREAPNGDHFFVAQDPTGQPVGFLHLWIERDFLAGGRACHISNLAVADGYDSQGIGRALLDFAQAWAKKHRCKLLTLSVFPGNARARALYERNGFTDDLLRMAKSIK